MFMGLRLDGLLLGFPKLQQSVSVVPERIIKDVPFRDWPLVSRIVEVCRNPNLAHLLLVIDIAVEKISIT